jgi:hypothetical protein
MNSKRILSMVFAMVLIFSNVLAAPISSITDMPTGWSEPAVTEAVTNDVLTSDNGLIRPMDPLTRAEMAEGITNAFGATKKADLSAYTDVPVTKWYYEAMQEAVAMGIISGYPDSKFLVAVIRTLKKKHYIWKKLQSALDHRTIKSMKFCWHTIHHI